MEEVAEEEEEKLVVVEVVGEEEEEEGEDNCTVACTAGTCSWCLDHTVVYCLSFFALHPWAVAPD